MTRTLAAALVVALLPCSVAAQSARTPAARTPEQTEQLRRGKVAMLVGTVFLGIGAIILPITAIKDDVDTPRLLTGLSSAAVGTYLLWWGASERARAARPSTTIGVSVGRSSAIQIQIQRTW